MSDMERYYKLVKKFLETYKMDGICEFMVDWSPEDDNPTITVYIVIDIDWLKKIQIRPESIARKLRERVKDEIKKWLGVDVYVGSIARKCNEDLSESSQDYIVTKSQLKKIIESVI